MNNIYGWILNGMGITCFISGNFNGGVTCCCTAIILFSLEGK